MAKSMRSKKLKRLRAIRREMVEPYYDNKDVAKLAAQEAALAAPKLPARPTSTNTDITTTSNAMDVEIADGNQSMHSLKPAGGIGKKFKRKFKMGKGKRRGKGIRRKHHI
ncbi:uncharacterized protein LOC132171968 [Corylus avellana]|uniref:uncharacterized protein LOC132171592 n=1 Tax=Corylus avellana TaxID=13451 RepID=UPI00286CE4F0|nr:uncharacterized protein LOC132171592 [Corylus avellana]XP_059439370.1 uncharacterized protein LOC132171968 [Corylus avellana]